MTSPKPTDPAFPLGYTSGGGHNGMTLRCWLAGQALAGLGDHYPIRAAADEAVRRADATLAVLAKSPESTTP